MWQSIKYGILTLGSRRIYIFAMVFLPLLICAFFLSLLNQGLPTRVPTAIVDLDHSPMSRAMTRSLDAAQLVHIPEDCERYSEAMEAVRTGRVFGFYVIPANFGADALAGRKPTIEYYANLTYFVPGTFSYKGYKTVAVGAASSLVTQTAQAVGVDGTTVEALVRPVDLEFNALHNPGPDYSLYLTPSFMGGVMELMVVLVTIFSITYQIKNGTSRRWLANSGGSILLALFGLLLPQTVVFTLVGWCCQSLMFGYCGFPLNCPLWVILLSMLLLVTASQAFGVFVASIMPNPRFGMSIGALLSILAFSFTGFSFPVQDMYGAISVFSYIMPVRYYFLLHITEALNGFPLYYARLYFVALLLFPFVALLPVFHLKRACLRPVYVP